jgi:quinol monooxygenase YgiN
MIIFRVSGKVYPQKIEEARRKFADLSAASRNVPGVISFDVAQDVTDPEIFISMEVYEDQGAVDRQGDLAELRALMAALDDMLAAGPRGNIFHVSTAEPWPR